MLNTKQIKCFLLDMDGTLYLGSKLFDGTKPFLDTLTDKGCKYVFLTNNSSVNTEMYVQKLLKLGLEASEDNVLSSSFVAAQYMGQYYSNKRVFVLGTAHLKQELFQHGVNVVTENPEAVLVGFDTGFVYDDLFKVCNYVKQGLPYITTHPDINCPYENNTFLPDVGSTAAFIKASTGRKPDMVLGKPSEYLLTCVKKRLNLKPDQLCMVGDRLTTDIAMGRHGLQTVLLLSGVTTLSQARRSKIKADLILPGIADLTEYLLRDDTP